MKVGDEDRLFGSVTAQMISEELGRQGHNIDRRMISLGEQIKTLGMYDVSVKLFRDVVTSLKVFVVDEKSAEAE